MHTSRVILGPDGGGKKTSKRVAFEVVLVLPYYGIGTQTLDCRMFLGMMASSATGWKSSSGEAGSVDIPLAETGFLAVLQPTCISRSSLNKANAKTETT